MTAVKELLEDYVRRCTGGRPAYQVPQAWLTSPFLSVTETAQGGQGGQQAAGQDVSRADVFVRALDRRAFCLVPC